MAQFVDFGEGLVEGRFVHAEVELDFGFVAGWAGGEPGVVFKLVVHYVGGWETHVGPVPSMIIP